LSAGANVSAVGSSLRSSANRVIETAETTNFASGKSQAAVEEIKLTQQEYRAALSRIFPGHQLDPIARLVDDIGQRAAKRLTDPFAHPAEARAFLKAMLRAKADRNEWKTAGRLFHDAAKAEARSIPAGSLPPGWRLTAEETIQPGKGGSRLDPAPTRAW
jgi:hypothetical protein